MTGDATTCDACGYPINVGRTYLFARFGAHIGTWFASRAAVCRHRRDCPAQHRYAGPERRRSP